MSQILQFLVQRKWEPGQVKDSMSMHSNNYRQNELKIRRVEATSDQ